MKFQLVISFQFPYLHHWADCNVAGKVFLKNLHRHLMKCRAWLDVALTDREVEFIDLKEKVEDWAISTFSQCPGGFSCEQIAEALAVRFQFARVEVLEDGENGAVVEQ